MLSADPFVAMAAAAVKTTRIRLGTGVLIPSNRIAPVAANAFASLNKLAPGRIDFGVGTGFTGRRAMGLGAIRLADHGGVCPRRHGAAARRDRRGRNRGQKAADPAAEPEIGLINTRDPIPLYVAASGPRARGLTAKLGAGWIDTAGDVEGGVAAMADMREAGGQPGARRAARSPWC